MAIPFMIPTASEKTCVKMTQVITKDNNEHSQLMSVNKTRHPASYSYIPETAGIHSTPDKHCKLWLTGSSLPEPWLYIPNLY
jgi:hypothetical protein